MDSLRSIYKYYKALSVIRRSSRVLILTHRDPDGDALASSCIISLLLDKLKKPYQIFAPTPPSPEFLFLPNLEKTTCDPQKIDFYKYDVILIVDCGSITRTGWGDYIQSPDQSQFIIEFDHHPRKESRYSHLEIRLPGAAATTEILYYFLQQNKIKINKKIAECLLTGLLTDTANFLHPSATKHTIYIASKMITKGAQFPKITKNIWQNKSIRSMKLWSAVLNNLKINSEYNIAFTVLTKEELEDFPEEEKKSLDAITNSLNNLKGVKAVVFLKQEEEDLIKGSLRTNHPQTNVARLANYLGGGGHVKAAGFSLEGKIKKTENGWEIT